MKILDWQRQNFFLKKAIHQPKFKATKQVRLSSLLLNGLVLGYVLGNLLFALPGRANIVLGVVRSPDNANEWGGIAQRLESAGIAYQVIHLDQMQRSSDLAGITVLFLPNIQTLTAGQVSALEGWMSHGGRAIASGSLGGRSPAAVRQTLRSLLGAYWAFPLPQSSVLQTQQTCTNEAKSCENWVSQNALISPVQGGVVIPNGSTSQTIATWNLDRNSPGVVVNERATFLGWQWGSDAVSPAEFDKAWLQAALNHYGYSSLDASTPNFQREKQGRTTAGETTNIDSSTLPVPSPPPSTAYPVLSLPPPPGNLPR